MCKRAPAAVRVVFERGPLPLWFYHALCAEGLRAICIDARHARAAPDIAANKTDANDADGLAHLAEVGLYREVGVKGFDSMMTRTLAAARTKLVHITIELSNQIRGLMKTFGLVVPPGKGSEFERACSRTCHRSGRSLGHRAATFGILAQHPLASHRAWGPARRWCTPKPGLSAPHVDPRHRRDHRHVFHEGNRGPHHPSLTIRVLPTPMPYSVGGTLAGSSLR
ncbi:hypothetical protein BH10PSE12_BH10PSE12_32700 [soil metagenome]